MSFSFRCDCPITSALDVLGDRWMLVIVKQMLIEDAMTFKDFVESPEAIATNILTSKLKALEEHGIVWKKKLPNNRKTSLYVLTESGLSLTPIIVELALWSDRYLRELNPTIVDNDAIELLKSDKQAFARKLQQDYMDKLKRMGIAFE
ncbi:MAG TPA: helix-turn-helix domain-containing protein [Alkalispirochaeta sp.]|nr:helix-turn-helix domain-containing protein [Alkalispirochaeta sp.]